MDSNTSTFRALSKTSLEIDQLTVETLFQRGSALSSSQIYIPTLSNVGAFSLWVHQPISTVYNSFFYGYSTPNYLFNKLTVIDQTTTVLSYFIQSNVLSISSLSNQTISTLIATSNVFNSTVSSLYSTLYIERAIELERFSTTNTVLLHDTPGILTMSTIFYTRNFSPYASTLIQRGKYLYLKRPIPLPNPLPWYWNSTPTRYIGPGLSSIYNNSLITDSNILIQTTYPAILSNTSTGWTSSNSSINHYRSTTAGNVKSANKYVDTGSSISTVFYNSNSSFIHLLQTTPNYVSDVKNLQVYTSTYFDQYIVPTYGPYISTGSSTIFTMNSTLNSTLFAHVSDGVLLIPLSTFSNIAAATFINTSNTLYQVNNVPGLCSLMLNYSTIFKPLTDPLSVSTNFIGYQNISSSVISVFSTFSTSLESIIGSNIYYNLYAINSTISSLSTSITSDYSTLVAVNAHYITGPGISTMNSNLSTNIGVLDKSYSVQLSSIILSYSTSLRVVNSVPGVSSLYTIGSINDSTITNNLSIITPYLTTTYINDTNAIVQKLTTVSTPIHSNTSTFITAGVVQYSTLLFSYSNISSQFYNTISNIFSMITKPSGDFWVSLSTMSMLPNDTYAFISTLEYSTSYFTMLTVIPDYSTSITVFPGTIMRSTIFYSVETSTLTGYIGISTFMTSTMNIQTSNSSQFALNVRGGTRIIPRLDQTNYPSLELPNCHLYASDDSVVNPITHTLSVQFSSIIFNQGNFTVKRRYNSQLRGLIGINMLNPTYAFDIGIGDARKLIGTMWLNPSDMRIKENIEPADSKLCIQEISSLRLVSYTWKEPYRSAHDLSKYPTLGFLSQEVELIFPNSITTASENGFEDFRSLDVDQLLKSKFGVKQNLLHRVSTLQSKINSLFNKV